MLTELLAQCSVDAWAIGILGYELIVGHPPFERETRTDTYEQIMYQRPNYPAWLSEESRMFISAALTKVGSELACFIAGANSDAQLPSGTFRDGCTQKARQYQRMAIDLPCKIFNGL